MVTTIPFCTRRRTTVRITALGLWYNHLMNGIIPLDTYNAYFFMTHASYFSYSIPITEYLERW